MSERDEKPKPSDRGAAGYIGLVALCLTIGLAPYSPEPHIVGKVRWVAGGANGMGLIDWADLVMHGLPWVLLVTAAAVGIARRLRGMSR